MGSVPHVDKSEEFFARDNSKTKDGDSPGNPLASLSEASMATLGVSFFTSMVSQANAAGNEWDFQDCEPDLVRLTSLESAASSEALLRLFGRKPTLTSSSQKLQPSSSSRQYWKDSGSFKAKSLTVAQSFNTQVPQHVPTLLSGPNSPESRVRSGFGASLESPRNEACSGSNCQIEYGAEAEYNHEVLGSTPATPLGDGGADTCPSPIGSVVLSKEQCFEEAEVVAREDPTCHLDPYIWCHQSLQSILASPGAEDCARATWDAQEGQELSPREILESSVLNIISDPAVKAKVLSLQLFTGVETFTTLETASEDPLRDDACGVPSDDVEESFDSEDCETPGSPPPLQRMFAARRENALEECWLTGTQKRRKAALELNEACADADFDWKRRRC